jgi:hypothetical protein
MFNTGARVQEVVALRATDLRLVTPPSVSLFGKGVWIEAMEHERGTINVA